MVQQTQPFDSSIVVEEISASAASKDESISTEPNSLTNTDAAAVRVT